VLTAASHGRAPDQLRLVIKPELSGFSATSSTFTTPFLVEELIDLLHDRGYNDAAVVGAADSSALWAENRDLYALSDLLGYRFVTPKGRAYDIVDLADEPDGSAFPAASALRGSGLSRAWLDADIRIVFAKNRTDEEAGYALCLDALLGVLPLPDKTLHYRRRRHPGDVAAALLSVAPVHLALIDAITSTHGAGGRRSPEPIETATLIASSDILLADYVGALKMGLDPVVSPILARLLRSHALPERYAVSGGLGAYPGWTNVPTPLLRSTQSRAGAVALDRLVEPWLQCLDPELFPLRHPLDARLNATLAGFFADTGTSPSSQWLLILANTLLGFIGQAIDSYRTLFDKDALHQQALPLGFDPSTVPDAAFDRLVDELNALEPVAANAPEVSEGLRWRYVEDAVVFRYARTLPIDHELFVSRVDVARTIQFMNDYLGGVIVPLAHDAKGRPIRQAERNIYLPQPNYLVLYHGKPIDVSKLEVVEYRPDRHSLYWKTIGSENDSATYDDGVAMFQRVAEGTRVTIIGRQLFTLPLFWQVFDMNLLPDLKAALVTHAYRTFFDRTMANFEALVEGRDIRIGRHVDEPAAPPAEQLMQLLGRISEVVMPLLRRAIEKPHAVRDAKHEIDSDGFVHIRPGTPAEPATEELPGIDRWMTELGRFVERLQQAAWRDLAQGNQGA